jgi:hypothetical protein
MSHTPTDNNTSQTISQSLGTQLPFTEIPNHLMPDILTVKSGSFQQQQNSSSAQKRPTKKTKNQVLSGLSKAWTQSSVSMTFLTYTEFIFTANLQTSALKSFVLSGMTWENIAKRTNLQPYICYQAWQTMLSTSKTKLPSSCGLFWTDEMVRIILI